ncbi:Metallo-hydrolase/oxidoreductase [Hortaea werneckii]|nr:Metallo-hydrolase/oxidoreductase [Hortaea werneckii]
MPSAEPAPQLNIPSSQHTVDVSIIDTTSHVGNIPTSAFMSPQVPGYDYVQAPCYSFLINHKNPEAPSKYDQLVFDLGVRKDWENAPAGLIQSAKEGGFTIKVDKDVATILKENGEDLNKIGGIVWSHYHFDHTGDPSTFPSSTDLIVGPGFKAKFPQGYPTNPEAPVSESAWQGRHLREIDFDGESKGLNVGPFRAVDLYGDGSFYLLDSPGHATGHMCGLARTSADPPEFMILGGDIAHHGGEFRPTKWLPLPENIQPNPLEKPYSKNPPVCPGELFEALHPRKSATEPFMDPVGHFHDDAKLVIESRDKWEEYDAQENIFAMIAHDGSLFDVVDFYPKSANGWKAKGWKEQGRWRFLRDFDTGAAKS